MRAAAQGFNPNDYDADPGDPEHGPAPDIVSGLATQIMAGVERVMFWVGRNDEQLCHDDVDWQQQPGAAPYWVDNTQWAEYEFERRLYAESKRVGHYRG